MATPAQATLRDGSQISYAVANTVSHTIKTKWELHEIAELMQLARKARDPNYVISDRNSKILKEDDLFSLMVLYMTTFDRLY